MAEAEPKDAEETQEEKPVGESAEEVVEALKPRSEPKTWTLGDGEVVREYVQQPMSFFAKIEFSAELGEAIDEAGGIEGALLPFECDATVGEVYPRQRHVGNRGQAPLDLRHAPGAVDALDREADVVRDAVHINLTYEPVKP